MRFFRWIKDRLSHKLQHLKWKNIKSLLKEHGLALVVIIVGWEIIEDVVFPVFFVFLGNNVHPAFYTGVPASLLLCFHWIMVPVLWGWWIKLSGKGEVSEIETCSGQHPHDHS